VNFKWVRGKLVGQGRFARVYAALNLKTCEMIAVKQVEIPQRENGWKDDRSWQETVVEPFKLESDILKDLDHPNVVQYLGFEETPRYLNMSAPFLDRHLYVVNGDFLASLNMFQLVQLLAC
jgi:mitogen-activated protein kinase kinase kinase